MRTEIRAADLWMDSNVVEEVEAVIREEVEAALDRVLGGAGRVAVEASGRPARYFTSFTGAMGYARRLLRQGVRDVQVVDRRGRISLLVVVTDGQGR